MELIDKEIFNKLWELNPRVNNEDENYENTRGYITILLSVDMVTNDGKIADFNLIYERYKLYCHIRNLANEGVEEKYQKKENKIVSIFEYLKQRMFLNEEKIPQNSRHFYLWGEKSNDEIASHFKRFSNLCK